jgi:hypothetical protein
MPFAHAQAAAPALGNGRDVFTKAVIVTLQDGDKPFRALS